MRERFAMSRAIAPGSPGVEFAADGITPTAVRIWRPGRNDSTKGPVFFTKRSADLIMAAYRERGMPLAWDYEHETSVPAEERPVAASKGYGEASAKFSALELRGGDGSGEEFDQELWSVRIDWTDDARAQIVSGKRRQVSPFFATEKDSREIVEIYSMALCFEGATNRGAILTPRVARLHSRGTRMEEIRAQLQAAYEAQDWDAVKAVLDSLAGLAVPSNNPDAALAAFDRAGEQLLSKFATWAAEQKIEAARHSRGATTAASPEVLEMRSLRVASIIEREPDGLIGSELEKLLMSRGDAELAKATIADAKRRQTHGRTDVKPPHAGGGDGGAHGLTPEEIDAARRSGLTLEQYAAGKRAHAGGGRRARKGG